MEMDIDTDQDDDDMDMDIEQPTQSQQQQQQPATQRRAQLWAVDKQKVTTRPATCHTCKVVFATGDLRLSTWGARAQSRWTCSGCLCGSLPESARFRPYGDGTPEDAAAARAATQVAGTGAANPAAEAEAAPSSTHPAWAQSELPNKTWWEQLPLQDALQLGSTTYVQTPDRFRGAVLDARDKLLEVLDKARQQGEAAPEWKAVLLFDVLLYTKTGQTSCAELLEERLAWFWGAQWEALWASVSSGSLLSRGPGRKQTEKQLAARVHTLAAAGEEGRALAATGGRKLAPRTQETLQKTRTCFPRAARAGALPDRQPAPPTPELWEQVKLEVRALLRRPPRLTAPGLLGSRLEHLSLCSDSPETLGKLAEAVTAVTFGQLPQEVLQSLRVGDLVALEKNSEEVRPVLVSATFRRLGLRALVKVKKEQLAAAAGTTQYGVGRKGGAELLFKQLLAQAETRPNAVFLKVDIKAAFQRLEREPAWRALQERVPDIADALKTWYSGPVEHLWRDSAGKFFKVLSDRGVDQGCPLAAAAFAVAQRTVLEPFLTTLRGHDALAKLYSYLDDTYLVVCSAHAHQALQGLQDALATLGLSLNHTKTQAWSPAGATALPLALQRYYTPTLPVLGKHLRTSGDTNSSPVNLGQPGAGLQQTTQRLGELWVKLQQLQKAGLKKQAAGALLRTYAGAASQHALRTGLAGEQECRDYDELLSGCWAELAGRSFDDTAKTLLGLPTKLGGVGVQYATARRNAAFFASWSTAVEEVAADVGCTSVADALDCLPVLRGQLEQARSGLAEQGVRLSDGAALANTLQYPSPQGLMMEKVQKTTHVALKRRLPFPQKAELAGAGGPGSSGFLAYPTEAVCSLEDTQWSTALRQRLHLRRAEHDDATLPLATGTCKNRVAGGAVCGQALDDRGFHSATCQCGGGVLRRHARLGRVLGSFLTRWRHEAPLFEQRVPAWDRLDGDGHTERAVLDLQYQDEDGARWIDGSIRHPAAGSAAHVQLAARRDGEASRRGERDKHTRYPGDRLVPFVLEVGGRVGAEGRHWLRSLTRDLPADQQTAELTRAYKAVSCVLQSEVARQLRTSAGLR